MDCRKNSALSKATPSRRQTRKQSPDRVAVSCCDSGAPIETNSPTFDSLPARSQ